MTTVPADGQPFSRVGIDDEQIAVDERGRTTGYHAFVGEGCRILHRWPTTHSELTAGPGRHRP
ncbi:hypothetical protein [Kineococcus radiotolerans]|uniref:hypothetical protein n=1 Tax=Kineococcus radiotolerans TaxID=131568 RepID=UPI00059CF490|nr:hypothetical protein [Kineococcus radiotolerans]